MRKVVLILLIAITMVMAGCSGDETETTTYTDDEYEVTVTAPEDAEDQWCPVGTIVNIQNPDTGESLEMVVVGTEVVNGVTLCKAVVEIMPPTDDIVKVEYLWSDEGETFIWTSYDISGNVVSEMTMIDGTMTITDETGQVMTFDMNEK
ncbi:hypothetical protein [Methanococcoides sp. FTZ1]|uniref:hypothetical protein n=1 Tax=Methanococcoides sp. FTZ1 TaxID=3439061 RepID=UPI003F85127C